MQVNTAPQAPSKGTKLRRFVFTLNNWTEQEMMDLQHLDCKWIIVGKERGAEGTPHLQGAVVLNTQKAFSTIKKMPCFARAHIEPMLGSIEDNIKYCSKEDKNPFTKGDVAPGRRNDIHDAIKKIKDATSLAQLVTEDDEFASTFVKYSKGLTAYRNMRDQYRTDAPTVIWIYGPSGTGKTESSVQWAESRGLPYWMSNGTLQWFDGYDGEPICILDDFRSGHCKFSFLLRLLDRYRFSVPVKGSFRNWSPKYILITAPMPPREMFDLKKEGDILQLERRINFQRQSPITVFTLTDVTDKAKPTDGNEERMVTESTTLRGDDAITGGNASMDQTPEGGEELSEEDTAHLKVNNNNNWDTKAAEELTTWLINDAKKKPTLKRSITTLDLTEEEEPKKKKTIIDLTKNKLIDLTKATNKIPNTQYYDSDSAGPDEESDEDIDEISIESYDRHSKRVIDEILEEAIEKEEEILAEEALNEEIWRNTVNKNKKT